MFKAIYKLAIGWLLLSLTMSVYASGMAPVSGFARSFIFGIELSNATLTILETGEKIKTDAHGHFEFQYPIGKPLTMQFEKWNFKTVQSATVIVPPEGLTDPLNNITFQVPSIESYYLLRTIIGGKEDPESCHVAVTITAFGKTMDDDPQGEEGATIVLFPNPNTTQAPFYFDIFRSGPLKGKTNPFTKGLTKTSEDGGALLINLPPSDTPYTLTAEKSGVHFSQVKFLCRKGAFINISPPRGPSALR